MKRSVYLLLVVVLLAGACFSKKVTKEATAARHVFHRNQISNLQLTDAQKIEFINVHNELRNKVASGEVVGQLSASNMEVVHWDDELATKASSWAFELAKRGTNVLTHNPVTNTTKYGVVGENMYIHGSTLDTGPLIRYALTELFNEHEKHIPAVTKAYRSIGTGHFTQLMWHDSHLVGCGIARRPGFMTYYYIVCNYHNPGNRFGQAVYAEGRACSNCPAPHTCDSKWTSLCLTTPGGGQVDRRPVQVLPPTLIILDQNNIKSILDKHNELRNQIASGSVNPHPQAADMEKMYWDDELAQKASAWSFELAKSQVPSGNNNASTRSYPVVGENIFIHSYILEDEGLPFDLALDQMFAEHKKHKIQYTTAWRNDQNEHFTQIIWHSSKRVGCGASKRRSSLITEYFLVCNYVFKGNNEGRKVYTPGLPCSQCPGGHRCDFRYGSLCDTEGKLSFRNLGAFALPLSAQEQTNILERHNIRRNEVASGSKPPHPQASNMEVMYWDNELTIHAQRWAEELARSEVIRSNPVKRTGSYNPLGENIYYYETKTDTSKPVADAVDAWFNEISTHPVEVTSNYRDVGTSRFTQIVWHESKRVGCGAAKRVHLDSTFFFVVCNYYPAGNYNTRPVYLLGSPCSACPGEYTCSARYKSLCDSKGELDIRRTGVFTHNLIDRDQVIIVETHNKYRNQIASGSYMGQPPAANMEKIYWSVELAIKAEAWSREIANRESQDSNPDKTAVGFPRVGENIYVVQTITDETLDLAQAIATWFNQVSQRDPKFINSYQDVGTPRYSQIVYAQARRVGCGATKRVRARGTVHYLVCNYWERGNVVNFPVYLTGTSCSKCPGNTVCDAKWNSLCETKGELIKTTTTTTTTVVPVTPTISQRVIGVFHCPLNQVDREALLHNHNLLRSRIASGAQLGQDSAANMRRIVYDLTLEQRAIEWSYELATRQRIEHNPVRGLLGVQELGENIYYYGSAEDLGAPIQQSTAYWYKFHETHPKNAIRSFWPIGTEPFTQLVWADTCKVGCGVAKRVTLNMVYYYLVCYYDPAGNAPTRPVYIVGPPCSQCPAGSPGCDAQYPGLCR